MTNEDDFSDDEEYVDDLTDAIEGVGNAVTVLVDQFGYDVSTSVVVEIDGVLVEVTISVAEIEG